MTKDEIDFKQTVGLLFVLSLMFFLTHELTHVSIAKDYNCQDISVHPYPDLETNSLMYTSYDCSNLGKGAYLAFHSDQQMVEAVGYQLYAAIMMILSVFFIKL